MSFTPWKFFRNPPQTVPSPAIVPEPAAPSSTNSTGGTTNTSRAVALMGQLGNLAGTAQYLQSIILSLTNGLGVNVDTDSNPDLGRALSAIYGSVPPAISSLMYSNLLDVELGAQQVLVAAGADASIQPNPFQQQAVVTVNKAFEAALSSQGDFESQTPLMLRGLKTQSAVYQQWQLQLASYPASAAPTSTTNSNNVIQASTVDVGDDVNQALQDHVAAMTSTYTSAYNMLATASSISQDIVCMVNTFSTLTTVELAQMKSLFTLVNSTDASESMQDISNGLTSFVFVGMMSQASSMVFSLDRVAQMAIAPLASIGGTLGAGVSSVQSSAAQNLQGVIRSTTQTARLSTGPLAGLLASNTAASACGAKTPAQSAATQVPPSPSCVSGASGASTTPTIGLSLGMNDLATLLDWSLQKANKKISSSLQSFTKLMSRMQGDTCNQIKLLTIVNNLGTLSSLADAFLTQKQSTGASTGVSSATQLSTVGSILAATKSGNGTTYTVQNGVVTITPPAVPAPTPAATAVLSNAGVQTSLAGISQPL